jgi:hypothetical protein
VFDPYKIVPLYSTEAGSYLTRKCWTRVKIESKTKAIISADA